MQKPPNKGKVTGTAKTAPAGSAIMADFTAGLTVTGTRR